MTEIVIKIDDGIYQDIVDGKGEVPRTIVRSFQATIADEIKNGTPLPKGHGRIGDLDIILTWLVFNGIIDKLKCGEVTSVFKKATILEKNKESE